MAKSLSPIHSRQSRRSYVPKAQTIDFPLNTETPNKIHIVEETVPKGGYRGSK